MSQICDFWIAQVGPIKIDMWIDERKGTKIKVLSSNVELFIYNSKE